jgi:hypothetical protein
MAITIPLPEVPESRVYQGIGSQLAIFLINPGVSDYVTGGYVLNAALFGMTHITGADIVAMNAIAASTYNAIIVFPATYFPAPPALPAPATSINFLVQSAFGTEVINGFNLTLADWAIRVVGY